MPTPTITLKNANNKFSEIDWTYTDLAGIDIAELALISVTENDANSLITKKILIPSQTYINLIDLVDLTLKINICIEVTHTNGNTYSSNVLTIPKRLNAPAIYNPEASSASPYKIVTKNQAVDFFVYNIDSTIGASAQKFNLIVYESTDKTITELPDIPIPSNDRDPTSITIHEIFITCNKITNDIYKISLSNLQNDGIYQIGMYVTNRYTNNASPPQSNIENESNVSNTIQYIEPRTGPQTPTLRSVSFKMDAPYFYTFELMTPSNSNTYTTTYIKIFISTTYSFTPESTSSIDLDIATSNQPLPSSTVYIFDNTDLTGKINAGTTYYYKAVFYNSDSNSETVTTSGVSTTVINTLTPKTNVLSIQACSKPSISDSTALILNSYPNMTLTWSDPTTDRNVSYFGSGTIQTNVNVNGNTNTNVKSPYSIAGVPGSQYTISLSYSVVNIITKTAYHGVGASPVITNTYSTYNNANLVVGPFTTEPFFTQILPVTYIKASVLSQDNSTPIPNRINLNWTPSTNVGINPQYQITYSDSASFANPFSTITTSDTTKTITGLTNDAKKYFKIVTTYPNAPIGYFCMKSGSLTVSRDNLSSIAFKLIDKLDNPIGVSPFNNVTTPINFLLEAGKKTIKSSWNSVTNPLASSGAPATNARTPYINYSIQLENNVASNTMNNFYTFNDNTYNITDGNTYTVSLNSNLNDVYPYFESNMDFVTASVVSFSSASITGSTTPFDGPDITNASYNPNTNVISLTIDMNGTRKDDTTLIVMGVTSNATTFSYTSLLNSDSLSVIYVNSNTNIYRLNLTPEYIVYSDKVNQFVAVTTSPSGISYATVGFSKDNNLNADTLKTIKTQVN